MNDSDNADRKAYLVGAGLASLAAAVYLLKDGNLRPENITIFESRSRAGGALGIFGDVETGFVYPGGRVFEKQYRCALDLFSHIPSSSGPGTSIEQEIMEFNARYGWHNTTRLVDMNRNVVDTSRLGLRIRHHLSLAKLLLTPESSLNGKRIGDVIDASFFKTNFWFIWSSIMAFRPNHSATEMRRYLLRYLHLLPELSTMTFILRTRVNQQQAIVDPLVAWLSGQGVKFLFEARVTDIEFDSRTGRTTAVALRFEKDGGSHTIELGKLDIVIVTNGSQLADMSIGTMTSPPRQKEGNGPVWPLWQSLADRNGAFGHPERVSGQTAESTWVSFTVTSKEARFNQLVKDFTGREAGRDGLMTFRDSNWLLTIVRFHQPNFIGQPEGVFLWWGYGIYPERRGNFVEKPMTECTGREILEEVLRHLKFDADIEEIVRHSICRPCLMPHAGSVVVLRDLHDRPLVVPTGSTNFAFIGQFTEQPTDVAFSMEYSVRSARTAVDRLLGLGRAPPPVYRGITRPAVVLRAIGALLR